MTATWGASFVLFHTDVDDLVRCVAALPDDTPVYVVVNDDPTGEDAAEVRARLPRATVESHPENLGYAGGHNAGLHALLSRGLDGVVVLNADTVPEPGSIDALAAFARDRLVLAGPLLELLPERRIDSAGIRWTASGRHLDARQGAPLTAAPAEPTRVAGISGACLYVSRAAHDAIVRRSGEFFDEAFVAYREDAELGFRAGLLGVPSYVVPAARVGHARTLRGTSRDTSAHVNRLGVQNRFLIAFKYGRHRPGFPWALLRDAVVVAAVLLRERSSLPGLANAWRLRHVERAKGRQVLAHRVAR